jgi:hypothetical protein
MGGGAFAIPIKRFDTDDGIAKAPPLILREFINFFLPLSPTKIHKSVSPPFNLPIFVFNSAKERHSS